VLLYTKSQNGGDKIMNENKEQDYSDSDAVEKKKKLSRLKNSFIKIQKEIRIVWFLPIFLLLLIAIIRVYLYPQIVPFLMDHKWEVLLLFATIIVYISWMHGKWFRKHKQNLRRTWYTFYIVGVALLLKENGFMESGWQILVLLASMFIFVDITLFLTPMIKKIGGTELDKIEEVEDTSEELRKAILVTNYKIEQYTRIIESFNSHEFPRLSYMDPSQYIFDLQDFLNTKYGDSNFLRIRVNLILNQEDLLHRVGVQYAVQLDDEKLEQVKNQDVIYLTETAVTLIPFDKVIPILIGIESKHESIHEIDVANIISLATVQSWMIKEHAVTLLKEEYEFLVSPDSVFQ
jgi:Toxin SpoIISA, type II toxin-antitoxin system